MSVFVGDSTQKGCVQNPMVMDTVIRDFAAYLEAKRGYSALTASSYRYDLQQFCRFLKARGMSPDFSEVTTTLVREWVIELHDGGLVNNTVARHLYALRSFWDYLRLQGLVSEDPVREVSVPKPTRNLPRYLPKEDLEKIPAGAQRNRTARCGFRNYAMMCTLIFTGMRKGELISLKLGDVSLSEKRVRVRGKGDKLRIIPLVEKVVEAVADWLQFRPQCQHDYLFTTFHGNPIHPTGMQRIWRGILAQSEIEGTGVTLHTLRHSMATLLLQSR